MKLLKNTILTYIISILLSIVCCYHVLGYNDVAQNTNSSNDTLSSSIDKRDINLKDINISSSSAILVDSKTGNILYSKDAYEKMYPASTTKLMTAILTLENCKLTDTVTVSHNAIYSIPVGYSHANLKEGEQLTVEQLLNVLLIPSANDAAVALAEHISGTVEGFSTLMNNKAKELGCISTNFVNPNGIHDKNHYSCAYDLSLIGQYAMQFPDIMRIAQVRQYTLPTTNKYNKTDRIFNATNTLLNNESLNKNYYQYATGLKTGYTDKAGSCIIATAKKDDTELLTVVLKGNSSNSRDVDCKTIFEYGFNNYTYKTLNKSNDVIQTIEIENATKETKNLDILVKDSITVLLKNTNNENELKANIELLPTLKAPIAENSVVGKISYEIDGKTYTSDLMAGSSVYPSSFEVIVFRILLIFLILYILYKLLKHTNTKSKNNRRFAPYKKTKKRNNKRTKFNKEKGQFRFTQINDYL